MAAGFKRSWPKLAKENLFKPFKVTSNHLDLESAQVKSEELTRLEEGFLIREVSDVQLVIFGDHNGRLPSSGRAHCQPDGYNDYGMAIAQKS